LLNHLCKDVVSLFPKNFDMGSKPKTTVFI
jgi:hypothetical protein